MSGCPYTCRDSARAREPRHLELPWPQRPEDGPGRAAGAAACKGAPGTESALRASLAPSWDSPGILAPVGWLGSREGRGTLAMKKKAETPIPHG